MGINIPVLDMYGMSEGTGPMGVATIKIWRLGSVGQCLDGTHLKIDIPDENGEGEVSDIILCITYWDSVLLVFYRFVHMVGMCSWAT